MNARGTESKVDGRNELGRTPPSGRPAHEQRCNTGAPPATGFGGRPERELGPGLRWGGGQELDTVRRVRHALW